MSFPFPQLLAFLDQEKDQVEFMKLAAEVGLGSGDIELAKLLLALQLYKAYYAAIPRQIKAVHEDALEEIRRIRDEAEFMASRAASDAVKIGQWAEEIHKSLQECGPERIAAQVHKRLTDETFALLGGSLQALGTASRQVEVATKAMDEAGYRAAVCIDFWHAVSLRRVWASAFCFCLVVALLLLAGIWFVFLRHQGWWLSLQ
ncbi:MAG: hypothetical protein P4L99_17180 [Chthoniobacter sp.]|nr:hypothetical protein [Chthoniobacter sp.]